MNNRPPVLSVSELTRQIKRVLEEGFPDVSVRGEVSNFKRHTSGHLYFTIKDESAQIQAVMWRSRAASLFFTPQDGMMVIAYGRIGVYEVRGSYQVDVASLQPLGTGDLQLAFERLKKKLFAEGLFDASHKKPLPRYPNRIGIVTSATGAAIRDIVNIIARRFPAVELVLAPVTVQGAGAAESIAGAIRDFNLYGKIDVMIVGRGGGSIEDLWPFNEEVVARAIYDSRIPVISAVGHEVDYTIADFVADLRAPTPSAAAEIVIPEKGELVEFLRNFHYTAGQLIRGKLTSEREKVVSLVRSHSFNRPIDLLRQYSQHHDELRRTLTQTVSHRVAVVRERIAAFQKRLESVRPDAILSRGYTMILRGMEVIASARRLKPDDAVRIKFHDGEVPAGIR